MALGGLVLGSPILYLKGMRLLMFQLSDASTTGPKFTQRPQSSSFLGLPYGILRTPKRNYFGAFG